MSQVPPNPYGNQPPPQPQYGQGYPPPVPPGYGPQGYPGYVTPPRTSGAAIASLILGFVGICVPIIGGLVAVILGIVGIGATGRPEVRGRGLAIAGLILGLLTMAGWGVAGASVGLLVRATAPDRATARQFLTDLSGGNVTAAANECVPGTAPEVLQAEADKLQPLGAMTDSTFFGVNVNNTNGASTTVVAGSAKFGSTTKSVQVTLVPSTGGKHLIEKWQSN